MDKKQLKDILSAHADQLIGKPDDPAPVDSSLDEGDDELTALLGVAEQLKSSLTPITPKPDFESELKRELLTTAHLRQATGYVPPNPERDLLILTALFGLIIGITGIWMFLLYQKRNTV